MKKFGLTKNERVYLDKDFENILTTGRKVQMAGFVFWYKPNPLGTSNPRIGIIVSKKLGSATVRNRCKRLLRDAFRHNKHLFGSAACVIYPKDSAMLPSYEAACKIFLKLLDKATMKKINILKENKGL